MVVVVGEDRRRQHRDVTPEVVKRWIDREKEISSEERFFWVFEEREK